MHSTNTDAYLKTYAALRKAFPHRETATFTEIARWMGVARGETLRETKGFPRVTIGKRDVVPLRALAVYMTRRST